MTIAIHQTSKPHELAREINKLTDGIVRASKLAAQYLVTLKAGKPLGISWEHYLKDCMLKLVGNMRTNSLPQRNLKALKNQQASHARRVSRPLKPLKNSPRLLPRQ